LQHVQNLLALDGRYGYANTYQVGFPSHFLLTQRFSWLLSWLLDATRPMDNMAISFATPSEDEIAINLLSGGISPYAALTFMPSWRQSNRYCTFKDSDCEDAKNWTDAFLWFMKKITFACGGKPLILKSPVHIGRLPILLSLFPRARFVFVHRDPVDGAFKRVLYATRCLLKVSYS
jgi:omega-hydroxy-beta-dihydromenaquinone-9 sulfotransferase